MPGDERGLGINTLGEQDAGAVEQGLSGDAELSALQAGDELAVQPIVVLARTPRLILGETRRDAG